MRDCTLYHPEDKHCIQLDVIDNLFHIRILHNYAAADPIHSITIHHYHTVKPHVHVAAALNGMRLLHMRLSHFNMRKIRKSIQHGSQFGKHFSLDNLKDLKEPSDKPPCKACLLGISHDPSKHRSHKRAESCGDLIHISDTLTFHGFLTALRGGV
ncbi:hypothetical protein NFJ02_18g30310 [Pycnococcus provasolii]